MDRSADIAWAAGLFEGEGCFALAKNNGYPTIVAQMNMVDEDVVTKFAEIMGGNARRCYPPSTRLRGHSPYWQWRVRGAKADEVYRLFEPFLSTRRRQKVSEIRGRISEIREEMREARARRIRENPVVV